MNPRRYVFSVVTDGSAVATCKLISPQPLNQPVSGHVKSVQYVPPQSNNLADSAALTLTATDPITGAVQTVVNAATITAGNTAQEWSPKKPTHTAAGAAALYAAAGVAVLEDFVLADEVLALSVASGGNNKTGTIVIVVE